MGDPDNTIWIHEKYGNEPWARRYFGTTREQTIQGRYELVRHFEDLDVYDRLVSLFEAKKRWPDLIATLNAKAEHLPEPEQQISL